MCEFCNYSIESCNNAKIGYTHLCQIIIFKHFKTIKMKTLMSITKEDVQITVYAYEPPAIELIEVTVEKGFADSITDFNPTTW